MPVSVAQHAGSVRVLNGGPEPGIAGFALAGGKLTPTSRRALEPGSDPAQIAFTPDGRRLVVTERGTNAITVLDVALDRDPTTYPAAGATPYGFDFANGTLVVTEAFGGRVGAAATSSYRPRRRHTRHRQHFGRRRAQRGLLGGRERGRPYGLGDELRRRDDLALRRGRRRLARTGRSGCREHRARRQGHPRRRTHR